MSFTDEMKKIGENISASYDTRVGTLDNIFKDSHSTLKDARSMVKNFHGERMHMSEELRSELLHFRKELSSITEKLMNGFAKEHKEMAETLSEDLDKFHHTMYRETHTMLNEFRSAFERMSDEMHKMLSKYYKEDIQGHVENLLGNFHRYMKSMADDFQKAHQAWIGFSRSINAKRGMKQAPKKMETKSEQICSILQGNPKSMTMGMIAKEMGCSSQSLRTPMQNLKKQGRISKRQNKYFYKG